MLRTLELVLIALVEFQFERLGQDLLRLDLGQRKLVVLPELDAVDVKLLLGEFHLSGAVEELLELHRDVEPRT